MPPGPQRTSSPRKKRAASRRNTLAKPPGNAEKIIRALPDTPSYGLTEKFVDGILERDAQAGRPIRPQTKHVLLKALDKAEGAGLIKYTANSESVRITRKGLEFRAMIMEQISSEDPESEEYDKEFNEIIKKEWKRLHRASTRHELSVEVRAYKAQYGPMDELDPDDKTVAGEDNDIRSQVDDDDAMDVDLPDMVVPVPEPAAPLRPMVSFGRPVLQTPLRKAHSVGNVLYDYPTPESLRVPQRLNHGPTAGPSTRLSPPASPSPSRTSSTQQLDAKDIIIKQLQADGTAKDRKIAKLEKIRDAKVAEMIEIQNILIDLETASLGYAVHRHPPMVIDFAMIVKSISGTHNTQIETYEKRLKECERNIDGLQAELDEVVEQGADEAEEDAKRAAEKAKAKKAAVTRRSDARRQRDLKGQPQTSTSESVSVPSTDRIDTSVSSSVWTWPLARLAAAMGR